MVRRPGSPDPRHAAAVAAAFACLQLAGCGGHSNVAVNSAGSPSTGVSSGGSVSVQGSSTLGKVLAIGVLVGASAYGDRVAPPAPPAPAMDPSRRVVERDCTQPIDDWSANLRCR